MDKVSVKCSSCGRELSLPASGGGGQVRCSCGNLVAVPRASGEQAGATRLRGALKDVFKDDPGASDQPARKREPAVAQIPSTLLTVEYVDGSEGMEAALKGIENRLDQLEHLAKQIQEATAQLASAVSRQAVEIERLRGSLSRRAEGVSRLSPPGAVRAPVTAAAQDELDVPQQYAADQDHQKAWQLAQVVAADLEAYYEDQVREGALQDDFFQVLKDPINEARKSYEQGVAKRVLQEFDYFTLALKRLVARKRRQLAEEQPSG